MILADVLEAPAIRARISTRRLERMRITVVVLAGLLTTIVVICLLSTFPKFLKY